MVKISTPMTNAMDLAQGKPAKPARPDEPAWYRHG
jgi:hypothetical protein